MISIFCNLAPQNNQFGTKKNCCYCLYCCHIIVATIIVVILKLLLRHCCNKNMSICEAEWIQFRRCAMYLRLEKTQNFDFNLSKMDILHMFMMFHTNKVQKRPRNRSTCPFFNSFTKKNPIFARNWLLAH